MRAWVQQRHANGTVSMRAVDSNYIRVLEGSEWSVWHQRVGTASIMLCKKRLRGSVCQIRDDRPHKEKVHSRFIRSQPLLASYFGAPRMCAECEQRAT